MQQLLFSANLCNNTALQLMLELRAKLLRLNLLELKTSHSIRSKLPVSNLR